MYNTPKKLKYLNLTTDGKGKDSNSRSSLSIITE